MFVHAMKLGQTFHTMIWWVWFRNCLGKDCGFVTIRLRQMATAFLCHGSDWLLMQRAETRALAPGLWAGVGGHLEPHEISDPEQAVLREVEEETGICADQIRDFRLQALVHRRRADEIRLQYLYVGWVSNRGVKNTVEGTLHWVSDQEVLAKSMTASTRFFLERYFGDGPSDTIWVGTLGNDDARPAIHWALLEDWEP